MKCTALRNEFLSLTLAAGLALTGTLPTTVMASDAGAFLGGMVASRVLGNMRRRTDAEEYAAYSQPRTQTVYVDRSSSSSGGGGSTKSVEQKLDELNTLASKGYISKSEYAARKKAIVDGI